MMTEAPLRLIAFDREDLNIVSAHAQDGILRVGDVCYDAQKQLVSLIFSRFDWEDHIRNSQSLRRRSVLDIRHAIHVSSQGIDRDNRTQVLNLLAMTFREEDAPSGSMTLHFSGNAAIQIRVECLEITLADLDEAWQTHTCPSHPVSEEN